MKIGFYIFNKFYHAQLDPLYERLKRRFDCLMTEDLNKLLSFNPRIVVTADNRYYLYRAQLPESIIVWVRHGLAGKKTVRKAIEGADFACLSSPWFENHYRENGIYPRLDYWQTGFVSMDKVLCPSKDIQEKMPAFLKKDQATILYAPTWNRYLSSLEMFRKDWIKSLVETYSEVNLIIKPHPHISRHFPHIIQGWRNAAQENPERVHLVDFVDSSVYDYFNLSDMMISDASSVFLYYLALDKPLILINNPKRHLDKSFYDPEGPEWQWRDCAFEIETKEQLLSVVGRALTNPELKKEKRMEYKNRIFGDLLDGCAAERTAEKITSLAVSPEEQPDWAKTAWSEMRKWALRNKASKWRNLFYRQFIPMGYSLERYPRIKYILQAAFTSVINKIYKTDKIFF